MPDKPVVFLSSTIRSLKQLRTTVTEKIKVLGYEVVVAEHDFTATPGQSITQTCIQNVDRCDILVLIIDGTYGTPVNGEWLVRSEFTHANRQRKPVYVMVEKDAWSKYDWTKGVSQPNVAFDNYGIHPEVFRFLREIEGGGHHWIHPFEVAEDLAKKLMEQFAAHYAILLRSKSQSLVIRTAHLLEQMHNLYRQKNHVQALLFAGDALRIDPGNSEALVTRAVCRIRLHGLSDPKYIKKGIEDCERVIANDSRNYRAKYNLANFKLLSPEHDTSEVWKDLNDLFNEFPEYEYHFEEDGEFKRLLKLRESWSGSGKKSRHADEP